MTELVSEPASDPDAQAVVTDFLDFTEYFPSDLLRSLTLIRGLDETYDSNAHAVHELTKAYGSKTQTPQQNGHTSRAQISKHLERALTARESSYAEAARLFDAADRHHNRLQSIIKKLHALPKPPSRDPTPEPPKSSEVKRSRSGRKIENGPSIQRLTLNPPRGSTLASAILHRPRHRRVTIPGEVLPAFDPDSPIASTEVSDWEQDVITPIRPMLKLKTNPPADKDSLKIPKELRETVAYRKPTPPPEDAEIGSKSRPWVRLTEWEMYRLRKKMKKNHTWEPSDIMVRRELAERGRGWENYYRARAEAQARGRKLQDCDNLDKGPKQEKSATPATPALLERKESRKSERQESGVRSEAQIAAQEAELAARRLGDIGSAFKNLFSPLSRTIASFQRNNNSPATNGTSAGKRSGQKAQPKRKAGDLEASTSPAIEIPTKKQKTAPKPSPLLSTESPSSTSTTIKIPIKLHISAPSVEQSELSTSRSASRATSVRLSMVPKIESSPPPVSRPASRRSTIEPGGAGRERRRTATPVTQKTPASDKSIKTAMTAASQRPKREAPGMVMQSSQDGGPAVSISTRKANPNKKGEQAQKNTGTIAPQLRVDVDGNEELVDPEEETYCICGDISWEEMIECDLGDKVRVAPDNTVASTNSYRSARPANGFIFHALGFLTTHLYRARLSGTAPLIERSITRERQRMAWLEEAFQPESRFKGYFKGHSRSLSRQINSQRRRACQLNMGILN